MKKHFLGIVLGILLMILLSSNAFAARTVASGYCGGDTTAEYDSDSGCYKNLSWVLDSDGLMIISGTGKMKNYGNYDFTTWYRVKSLIVGNDVTSIGDYAFSNCISLTSVTIPKGVTSIGYFAFGGCSSLQKFTIRDGLTNISVSDDVTSIGDRAFQDCSKLASITIPKGVTSIGDHAFYNCSSLKSILIPDGVTSIGDYAFSGCSRLTSVTIPNGVPCIGSCTFCNCSSLESITIPKSVTSIGDVAFWYCNSLKNVYITDISAWCKIRYGDGSTNASNDAGDVYSIPMYYADNIYCNGSKVVSVTVPDGITELNYTFYGFKDLVDVIIPESVTSIGDYTFYNCSSLQSVNIPNGVTGISEFVFYGCSSLTNISLPERVTSIEQNAFYNCTSLENLTIPARVTSIGGGAFYNCSSLKSVTIPESVTSIGSYAFSDCSSLIYNRYDNAEYLGSNGNPYAFLIRRASKEISTCTIHPNARVICGRAFERCNQLTNIGIPNGVISIGDFAFSSCNSLTSIAIPDSVAKIGDRAFDGCDSLVFNTYNNAEYLGSSSNPYAFLIRCSSKAISTCTIHPNTREICGSAFDSCDLLTNIDIPNGVISIGDFAFRACYGLTSIVIPDSAACIGRDAFDSCHSLINILIPDSIKSIGKYAFNSCHNLTNIYYSGNEAEWKAMSIGVNNNLLRNATIHYNSLAPGITKDGNKTVVTFSFDEAKSAGAETVFAGIYENGKLLGIGEAVQGEDGAYTATVDLDLKSVVGLEFKAFGISGTYAPVCTSMNII